MTPYECKLAAWNRATPILDYDSTIWRYDDFGWVIRWSDHGNQHSDYGWEVDHVFALAAGGIDTLDNLRVLHWQNNARLGGMLGGAGGANHSASPPEEVSWSI